MVAAEPESRCRAGAAQGQIREGPNAAGAGDDFGRRNQLHTFELEQQQQLVMIGETDGQSRYASMALDLNCARGCLGRFIRDGFKQV